VLPDPPSCVFIDDDTERGRQRRDDELGETSSADFL
jgi:hypothetical protein